MIVRPDVQCESITLFPQVMVFLPYLLTLPYLNQSVANRVADNEELCGYISKGEPDAGSRLHPWVPCTNVQQWEIVRLQMGCHLKISPMIQLMELPRLPSFIAIPGRHTRQGKARPGQATRVQERLCWKQEIRGPGVANEHGDFLLNTCLALTSLDSSLVPLFF